MQHNSIQKISEIIQMFSLNNSFADTHKHET